MRKLPRRGWIVRIKANSLIYCIFISFYCNCKLLEGKKQAISFYGTQVSGQCSVSMVLYKELLTSVSLEDTKHSLAQPCGPV